MRSCFFLFFSDILSIVFIGFVSQFLGEIPRVLFFFHRKAMDPMWDASSRLGWDSGTMAFSMFLPPKILGDSPRHPNLVIFWCWICCLCNFFADIFEAEIFCGWTNSRSTNQGMTTAIPFSAYIGQGRVYPSTQKNYTIAICIPPFFSQVGYGVYIQVYIYINMYTFW